MNEEEINPADFCLNCNKYIGFRGFCCEKCHNEFYDDSNAQVEKDERRWKVNKEKTKLKKYLFPLALLIMGIVVGIIIGVEIGEEAILMKLSTLFSGANFDVDININETLLVESARENFKETLEEALAKKNLVCKSCD